MSAFRNIFWFGEVIGALFQEIAVVFVPQNYSSTQEDLELRASQAAVRLLAPLKPLSDKVQNVKLQNEQPLALQRTTRTNMQCFLASEAGHSRSF